MSTREALEPAVTSFAFIVIGMLLGNVLLILIALLPLLFVALSLLIPPPQEVEVERLGEDQTLWVDEQVSETIRVRVRGGVGVVTIGDVLPSSFSLEEGTNFKALWKGVKDVEAPISYRATCARRGLYQLEGVHYEARHFLQMSRTQIGVREAPRTYTVRPRPLLVKRVRHREAVTAIPMPAEAKYRFGISTTDFLEVRDYAPGDPYRMINWKATARRLSTSPSPLQVNEYEREGRKVVWIFLDSSPRMATGTTLRSALDYAVQAALGLGDFYLSRGCRVGLVVYNHDAYRWEGPFERKVRPPPELLKALSGLKSLEPLFEASEAEEETPPEGRGMRGRIILPDVGRRQRYRLMREMVKVEVGYSFDSLKEAVHGCRGHLRGSRPLFIIITMVEAGELKGLVEGVRALYRYTLRGRRPSILLVDVRGDWMAEEELAAKVVERELEGAYTALRALGVEVISWNPREESLVEMLARRVRYGR
ncbi:MAG: hypothetical protein AYL28_006050 [Candidatus Bathyarchaeota archaeon B23]|nr:MAG: hypothetical protein AYL28_006050 [Candidatus Bathyarchaeota archaeon B23]